MELPSALKTLFKYVLLHILILRTYIFVKRGFWMDLIVQTYFVSVFFAFNFLSNFFSHFCRYIDEHKQEYINNLKEAVAIKSVSAWPDHRDEIVKMMKLAEVKLKNLGATTELVDVGKQTLPDGSEIPLPPVLLGDLGSDPKKKTVLLYGHLDVQPALKEDGWDTEPFILTEKDGKLFGRGSTDDKGPVLCWIHALQAYKAIGIDIPVNLKVLANMIFKDIQLIILINIFLIITFFL